MISLRVVYCLCFLPFIVGFAQRNVLQTPALSLSSNKNEVPVHAKPAPPKGDGVFSAALITKHTFVCYYHGRLLTVEEELELYPDRYPDYCLQICADLSIDGMHSQHWSRLINHKEDANLMLHTDKENQCAYFTAARDIEVGEELCFDYGVAYFIFRGITPAMGTESRSLELPRESLKEAKAHKTATTMPPRSSQEVSDLLDCSELDEDAKRATLMRSLDFYAGVVWMEEEDQVEIPISLDGQRKVFVYSEITLKFLSEIVKKLWGESNQDKQ